MNRAYLVQTLDMVKAALSKNNTVPIFQSFCFSEGTVAAYNDTIGIVGPSEVEHTCGIHGQTLLGILSATSAEEVDLNLTETEAVLTAGKSTSKLPFDPEENFIFKEPTGKWASKVPFTQSLFEAISLCLETVSSDETQVALHGVTIDGDHLYSCNGDTITKIKIKDGSKGRYLMPTPFCEAVVKLWSSAEMTKGTLQFNEEWVFANFEDWAVYGRVLEIKDPIDFENLIKDTVKSKPVMVDIPDGLSEALSRARVLADPESQKTALTIRTGKMELLTETHMGTIKDVIAVNKKHGDVECSINASHIQRCLQRCSTCSFSAQCSVFENEGDVYILVSNMG